MIVLKSIFEIPVFENPGLKTVTFRKMPFDCMSIIALASKQWNLLWPKVHQICILNQNTGVKNYFEKLENQPLLVKTPNVCPQFYLFWSKPGLGVF